MKKKKRLKPKIRILLTFIIAIVLFGYVSFCMINYNISRKNYEVETQELQNKLHELKDKETDLNQEISKLKDDDYLARYAREEYLYSKEGEYVIKIEDKKEDNTKTKKSETKVSQHVIILNIVIVLIIISGIIIFLVKNKSKKIKYQQ